jgi:prepilin-type processing-associated H-X9-DG protein
LNNEKAWNDPENLPPRHEFWNGGAMQEELYGDVDVFFCPARSHTTPPDSASATDYVGITGVGAAAAELPLSDPHAGFFGYDRQISLKDIKDGTATTIAVVEVLDGGPWTAGGHSTVRGLVADGGPYLGKAGQFSSLHGSSWSTGVNVLFADASVRSIKATLSPEVFEAMATIAGGEQVEQRPD